MKYRFLLILIFGWLLVPVTAQEDDLTPYKIAQQRIEEARVSGTTELNLGGIGLDLAVNQLIDLPESIINLSQLQWLSLHRNQIISLPEELNNFSQLETLTLAYNNIQTLPYHIGNLQSLIMLDIEYNNIAALPDSITHLENLKYIRLNGNQLISPPDVVEQGVPAIQAYLRNQAAWHLTRVLATVALGSHYWHILVGAATWVSIRQKEEKTSLDHESDRSIICDFVADASQKARAFA